MYPDGRRATVGALTKAMVLVNRAAGLEQRSNHKIRKTVLSRMIESRQFSTTEIMERAGHRDYHTTQKYYARPLPDASAPDRVSSIIPSAISEWAKMGENG
jgi:integrase